jgi:hypothetical protein
MERAFRPLKTVDLTKRAEHGLPLHSFRTLQRLMRKCCLIQMKNSPPRGRVPALNCRAGTQRTASAGSA